MKMSDVFQSELFLDEEWLGIYCGERQVFKPNFHFDNWNNEANAAIEAINYHDALTERVKELEACLSEMLCDYQCTASICSQEGYSNDYDKIAPKANQLLEKV